MKVVLFCGDTELKANDSVDAIPKPMVLIGYRPILWHVMKYYSHFGHNDFILCLGYRGDVIKDYFVNYKSYISSDFTLNASEITIIDNDIDQWNITFVDTGINSSLAENLWTVKRHLEGEDIFLVSSSDVLTDLPLPSMIHKFKASGKVAMIMTTRPPRSHRLAILGYGNEVIDLREISNLDIWVNAGYFIFRKDIFTFIDKSEDLLGKTFPRLAKENQLAAFRHEGAFLTSDGYREKETLDEMHAMDKAPWQVWKNHVGTNI